MRATNQGRRHRGNGFGLLAGALDVAVRDGADSASGIDYSFSDPGGRADRR
ncbi:MAG: hypothetical protein ACR2LV_09200 [Solirubrobacteraceae bacterium]